MILDPKFKIALQITLTKHINSDTGTIVWVAALPNIQSHSESPYLSIQALGRYVDIPNITIHHGHN